MGERARLQGLTAQEAGRLDQLQRGEASRLQGLSAVEQSRLDQLMASGAFQVDMLDRKGQQYVEQQNINRITNMYGLSASNLSSSTGVEQQMQLNQSEAFGGLGADIAGAVGSGGFDFLKNKPQMGPTMEGFEDLYSL